MPYIPIAKARGFTALLVTYYEPANATAWVATIGIAATAINEILLNFVKE